MACSPTTGALAAGSDPARLAGDYRVSMFATVGPASGASATGTVRLTTAADGIIGSAAIALDSVGAQGYGDIGSTNPMAPGVLVLPQEDMILLRFGSEANRKDVQAFEGPYTVLHVRQITESGFSGTWASGAERTNAEGHFCAVRAR